MRCAKDHKEAEEKASPGVEKMIGLHNMPDGWLEISIMMSHSVYMKLQLFARTHHTTVEELVENSIKQILSDGLIAIR